MPDFRAMDKGVELARSVRRLCRSLDRATGAALAGQGVTQAEWMLLRASYEAGAAAPSVLGERAGLTRGAVTKLVDRLRAKRLMVRAAGGVADRRFQTIALTGEGARLVSALAPLVAEREAALFAGLTPARQTALLETLVVTAGPLPERGA